MIYCEQTTGCTTCTLISEKGKTIDWEHCCNDNNQCIEQKVRMRLLERNNLCCN